MKPEKSSLLQEEKSFLKRKTKKTKQVNHRKRRRAEVQSEAALSKPNHNNTSMSARENNCSQMQLVTENLKVICCLFAECCCDLQNASASIRKTAQPQVTCSISEKKTLRCGLK